MYPWYSIPEATELDCFLSDRLQDGPGSDLPIPGVVLFDKLLGLPVRCRICGRADRWLPEGRTFVCEHDPIPGVPCRVIDDVSVDWVTVGAR